MTRLYSYVVRYDDGAAPNPFGGICTLTICKRFIRSSAKVGDWIAGVGGKNAPSGDLSGRLVYAMRVSEVMPLADYDEQAPARWPNKIPDITSKDLSRRLGDCIYDYSSGQPVQRPGVHGDENLGPDLKGRNALIGQQFYYFGSKAIALPSTLRQICPVQQGHRSDSNAPFVADFETWIKGLDLEPGQLYGWPDLILNWKNLRPHGGCSPRAEDDADDNVGEC